MLVLPAHHGLRHHSLVESLIHVVIAINETIVPVPNPYGGQILSPNGNQFLIGPSGTLNTVIRIVQVEFLTRMLINESLIKLSRTAATSHTFSEEIRLNLELFWRVTWLSRVFWGRLTHNIRASRGQNCTIHVDARKATVSHVRPFLLFEEEFLTFSSVSYILSHLVATLWVHDGLHARIVNHLRNLILICVVRIVHRLGSLSCIQILLRLFSNCLHEAHPLFRTQMCFKLLGAEQFVSIDRYLIRGCIVLTWRYESALGTPHIIDKVTLQINSRTLKLVKPLIFQQLPHVFLGHLISLFNKLSFIFIEKNICSIRLLVYNIVKVDDLSRRICHIFEYCRIRIH